MTNAPEGRQAYRTDWAQTNRDQQRDLHDHFASLPDLSPEDRTRTERHALDTLLAYLAGHVDPEVLHAAALTAKGNAGTYAESLRRTAPVGRHEVGGSPFVVSAADAAALDGAA